MSAISGIGQIHITVRDIDRAVAFYRDTLGLPLLFQVPGRDMAFFDCGGVRLYLGRAESDEFASRPLLYYRVSGIGDEALRGLSAGIVFRDPRTSSTAAAAPSWCCASSTTPRGTSWR